MPFSPRGFIKSFVTFNLGHNLLDSSDKVNCPVSAHFLFALVYLSFKPILRRVLFSTSLRITESNRAVVPSKVLFSFEENVSVVDYIMNCFGIIISVIMSVYKVYKALKKYKDVKFMISMTRNLSRLTGYFC